MRKQPGSSSSRSSSRVVTYDWESNSDIKEELWNIFTYYCLCDDPFRINTMTMRAFCKMFRDSQLLGLERREIGNEDCNVVYVRTSQVNANRLMSYESFVNACVILAKKIFWDISRGDDAFREALLEYILPHAHRRRPQAVHRQMAAPEVGAVFKPVRTALVRIFEFYGKVLDEPKVKGDYGWERVGEKAAKVWYTKTKEKVGPLARARIKAIVPNPVTSASRGPHNMAAAMFNSAWRSFAVDFGLDAILTQMDLAEIFLASSKVRTGSGYMKFNQFCEALMRCALISSRNVDHPEVTLECRMRALFLHMARYIATTLRAKVDSKRKEIRVSNALGTLIQGSKTFQLVVTKQWFRDGQRDYLLPIAERARSGIEMLDDLVSSRGGGGGGGGGGRGAGASRSGGRTAGRSASRTAGRSTGRSGAAPFGYGR